MQSSTAITSNTKLVKVDRRLAIRLTMDFFVVVCFVVVSGKK